MRLSARHYATRQPVEVVCAHGLIQSICAPSDAAVDARAGWISPAWFDIQINGCEGHDFSSDQLTAEAVRQVVTTCRRHGIGAFCPTLVTNSYEALAHGLAILREAADTDPAIAAAAPAIHLEGPYISPEDGARGAHPRRHVRPPNWEEFQRLQDCAGGRIRLVTLAPEHEGSLAFIERLTAAGVIVALGHTAAGARQIRDAIAAGARLSTHLGNGCAALLPRHDNVLWEQLAADELWASLICDGQHLPPAVVRSIVRAKTPARIVLTCDASSLAGTPPGRYTACEQAVEVLPEGKIVVSGTSYLAGSWAFTDTCIGTVMHFAGVSLAEAVDMASARPRALLGLPPRRLQVGDPADLVLFDWEEGGPVQVKATTVAGRVV
jgi:N-acetylglucosamine-6-phosphate deacetylase